MKEKGTLGANVEIFWKALREEDLWLASSTA
jgi:hypothetical protein